MSERQITNRLKKLKELEQEKAELEKEIATLKGDIQAQMNDQEEMRVGNFIVRWTTVISNRIDTKALKKAFPTICSDYTKESQSRRFAVTEA